MKKPNGQYIIAQDAKAVMDFIARLPIRKVPGIGRVSERILEAFDIKTCGDLHENLVYLEKIFSPTRFEFLMRTSLGLSTYSHSSSSTEGRKGISVERTFSAISDSTEMMHRLKDLCSHLAEDMAGENIKGKTVTLKLKTTDFKVMTRSKTSAAFLHKSEDIFKLAKYVRRIDSFFPEIKASNLNFEQLLLEELKKSERLSLRLMGVRMSTLSSRSVEDGDIAKYFSSSLVQQQENQDSVEPYVCPICCLKVYSKDERVLSDHVERCLLTTNPMDEASKEKVWFSFN
jgi:nucleotidyltransferase/DNA polymerase involved in DNA repair